MQSVPLITAIRSVSNWSCGVPQESSIYKAYLSYIRTAKHFIYIENQFFISAIDQATPKNKIARQLYAR
jgi:phospholipase D1/2